MSGAAIAVSMENFSSAVVIEASESIQIRLHPLHDAASFQNLQRLSEHTDLYGYYGGHRLLMVCSWKLGLVAMPVGCMLNACRLC